MSLTNAQIVQVIIATIGLALNLLVGSVVTFGLKLKSIDLKLILLIALVDIYYYFHNLLRVVLISVAYLKPNPGSLVQEPAWWCPFDVTMDMSSYLSCIEMVAILGLMRYFKICKKRNFRSLYWYLACGFSYFSNLFLALGYLHNGYYTWSKSLIACIATESSDKNHLSFTKYYYFWFSNYVIRSALALIIIAFSYFNVTTVYYELISTNAENALKDKVLPNNQRVGYYEQSAPFNKSNVVERFTNQQKYIKRQKWITALKLCGAILAYSICLLPDIILTTINFIPNAFGNLAIDGTVVSVTNLLLGCYGIVSAIFVLLSHDPTRRYLSLKAELMMCDFNSCSG